MAFARARGSQSRCTPARAWPAVPGRPRLATARPRLMSSAEIRSRFTDFFVAANYTKVESSALVPCKNDNSLLFTNAGMVQFKEYFLNPDASPFQKAVSVQKCLRAGGKHNDLDNVGYTPRHHTFFEMLGNFQFAGGACKKDTIATSWKFLTNELNLPMDRLRVSVFDKDEESFRIWRNHVGVPESRIVRRGETDNFWSMGNDGPCGPCTEVFWDTGLAVPDDERWLEIWNLVFVQFNRVGDQLRPLPALCVDTGMGLERLASVLQNKQSNFDIDTFSRLKADTLLLVDKFMLNPDRDNELFRPSLHIVADHFRAVCFLIAEGVVPSNVGRGNILRRLIRRALLAGRRLGFVDMPFLGALYPSLLATLDGWYPDVEERRAAVCDVIAAEEKSFLEVLHSGLKKLHRELDALENFGGNNVRKLPPELIFLMHDAYGFSADLTVIAARERGWEIDMEAVEREFAEQKAKQGDSFKKSAPTSSPVAAWRQAGIFPEFTGYTIRGPQRSKIIAVATEEPGSNIVAIDPCPFYGHGGGQVADVGTVKLAAEPIAEWDVTDVFVPYPRGIALKLRSRTAESDIFLEELKVGRDIIATVDPEHRKLTSVHHTATHLLNAALRKVLAKGEVVQAGSYVGTDKLRFDFAHKGALSVDQLHMVENTINEWCREGGRVESKVLPIDEAKAMGAVANFTEKYGDEVRVIMRPPNDLVAAVAKVLRANKEATKELKNVLGALVGMPVDPASVRTARLRNGTCEYEALLHTVDTPITDPAFVYRRAKHLAAGYPDKVHVVVRGNLVAVATSKELSTKVNAYELLCSTVTSLGAQVEGMEQFSYCELPGRAAKQSTDAVAGEILRLLESRGRGGGGGGENVGEFANAA